MTGVPGFPALLEGSPPFNPNGIEFSAWFNNVMERVGARTPVPLADDYTAVVGDLGKVFFLMGHTLNLSAAADLTAGWWCYAVAPGVVQPDGSEEINEQASLTVTGSAKIICTGTGFAVIEGAGGQPQKAGWTISLEGGGSELAEGAEVNVPAPFPCTAWKWSLIGDGIGSIVIDIQKLTVVDGVVTDATSITGETPPTLADQQVAGSDNIEGWDPAIEENSWLRLVIVSCEGLTQASLTIHVKRA